jgi:hypothetical protein
LHITVENFYLLKDLLMGSEQDYWVAYDWYFCLSAQLFSRLKERGLVADYCGQYSDEAFRFYMAARRAFRLCMSARRKSREL